MSVLCILNKLSFEQIEKHVSAAQEKALQLGVPLALVYCAETQDALKQRLDFLRSIEARYGEYNVPLLTVIGNHATARATLQHHLKPLVVFDASLQLQNVYHSLQRHPHDWPGRVIGVNELAAMQEISCLL